MSLKSKWFYNFLFLAAILILLQEFSLAQEVGAGYKDDKFGLVCKSTLDYLHGGFGALLTAITGLGAIIASAVGGFRMAWALLVVSIGSFILQSYMEMWFGATACQ